MRYNTPRAGGHLVGNLLKPGLNVICAVDRKALQSHQDCVEVRQEAMGTEVISCM